MAMRVWQQRRNALGRFWFDRSGVSAIEFAIIAPIMLTLMLGAYDFGNAAQEQSALQQAVADAGAYAMSNPTNFSGMTTAVTNAFPSSIPSLQCGCINPSTGVIVFSQFSCTVTNITAKCTAPNTGKLIYITATAPYTPIGSMFSNAISNSTAEYVVRFQ
jgi:Flp pilus assembly protein TadG